MENNNGNSNVLKEAEMIVANYLSKIEENENVKKIKNDSDNNLKRKYKKLKIYTIISNVILVISIIMLIV